MESIAVFVKSGWKCFKTALSISTRLFLDTSTDFIFGLIHRNGRKTLPPINNSILLEPAHSLASKIRKRKLKSRQVVEAFINRIKEVNPILNAVVCDNFERAISEAKKVDDFIAAGLKDEDEIEKETPFLGVPFTNKDSIGVKGLRQTCGLVSRKDVICDEDADVVALMRSAGGISLGNTNTSEICCWWESSNNVYGTTNNPYDIPRTAGGSSGGEGSIIAAAGSVIGIGSDIGGSIRIPAVFNGVFGHKPTGGLVSLHGELPAAHGAEVMYSTIGPMCRYASDLVPLSKVLLGESAEKVKLDEQVQLSSLKITFMTDDTGAPDVSKVDPAIKRALLKVIDHFETTHGIKAKKVHLPKMKHSASMWFQKMVGCGGEDMAAILTFGKETVHFKWELFKWLFRCSNFTFPIITLGISEGVAGPGTAEHEQIIKECDELIKEFEDILGSDGIFIYPTHPRPPPFHHQPLFMLNNFSYTGVFNVMEFPSCSCPLGLNDNGDPIGIQVVANKFNDRYCLAVACELERAFGGWISPSQIV